VVPGRAKRFDRGRRRGGLERAIQGPNVLQRLNVRPQPAAQSGEARRSEGGGLERRRSLERNAQEVGLRLHEQCVVRCTTVDPKDRQRTSGIRRHRFDQIGDLKGDPLEGCTSDVATVRAAGEPEQSAASVGAPMRRTESRMGRDEHDASTIGDAQGEILDLGRRRDESQLIAEPLHDRSGHERGALEAIRGGLVELPSYGCQQSVGRRDDAIGGVEHDERARAIRALRLPGRKTTLTEECGLLVAQDPVDRDSVGQSRDASCLPESCIRGHHLGEEGNRNAERVAQLLAPPSSSQWPK